MGLRAKVVNLTLNGIDLIIGMDSLLEFKAQLDCAEGTCELVVDGQKRVIKTKERPGDGHSAACSVAALKDAGKTEMLSAEQAESLSKRGASSWLTQVQHNNQDANAHACASVADTPTAVERLVQPSILQKLQDDFKDVFEPITGCPPVREGVDHTIRLQPGSAPVFKRPYRLSKHEEEEIHKQIQDCLSKGLIEPGASPYGAPVLFVGKKDGSLRMCIDYRALKKLQSEIGTLCQESMICWTSCMDALSSRR